MKAILPVQFIPGEKVDGYVDQIYSISPEVKKRLEFLVNKPKTS